MANINEYKDSSELDWIFVKKWGNTYVAPREKQDWIFNFSPKPKKNWVYIKELDVWRSNESEV